MKNFTLEIYLMFIGCLLIILSSSNESVNYLYMGFGLVIVIISTVSFIIKIRKNKGEEDDREEG